MLYILFPGPSSLGNIVEDVTHPCNPNPCAANQLCEVNRKGCQSGELCLPYLCVPGKGFWTSVYLSFGYKHMLLRFC